MQACPRCRATYPEDVATCPEDGATLLPSGMVAAVDAPLEPGTLVGEYRVDRKLGSGTFGDVYAGEQPLIGKRVAIKLLHRKFSSDAEVVSRFVAEARAVNRIRHRHIIDIFSFGTLGDGRHYFVMELLDGLTLGELLEQERRLPLDKALPIFRGIAGGLDAAHEAGITHRDLKPDNVFLATEKDGSYFPKLLDFGVAKLAADEVAHKTATGIAIGTPRYMSPEQCRGKKVDHRADIYSLGALIHEVLTGRPLFEGESTMDVFFKHTNEPPPAMSSVRADLPSDLDAPVLAMLAKRPKDRPASAGEAVRDLIERARAAGQAATLPVSSASVRRVVSPDGAGATIERILADAATVAVRQRAPVPAGSGGRSAAEIPTVEMSGVPSDEGGSGVSVRVSEAPASAPASDPASSGRSRRGSTEIAPASRVTGTLLDGEGSEASAVSTPDATLRSRTGVKTDAPVAQTGRHEARGSTPWIAIAAGALVLGGIGLALSGVLSRPPDGPPSGAAHAGPETSTPSAPVETTSPAVTITPEPASTAAPSMEPPAPSMEATASSTASAAPQKTGTFPRSTATARPTAPATATGKPIATSDLHHDLEPPPPGGAPTPKR